MIELIVRHRLRANYSPRQPPQYGRVQREGILFDYYGETIELFTVGALALALDRKPAAIVAWEREGLLPRPMFRVIGKGRERTRYYWSVQLINANRLVMLRYGGQKYMHDRILFCRFIDDLRRLFYEPSIAIEADRTAGKADEQTVAT